MTDALAAGAARRAYGAGIAVTLGAAIAGEGLLHRLPAGQGPLEAVTQVGYTFTGLCLLGAVLLARRIGRTLVARRSQNAEQVGRLLKREYLFIAFACTISTILGLCYWVLGGRRVERHARTYIALAPVAFLALAPRPARWLRRD